MLFLMYVVFLCVVSLCMLYVLRIVCCISVYFCILFINECFKFKVLEIFLLNIFRLISFKFGSGRGPPLGVLVIHRI